MAHPTYLDSTGATRYRKAQGNAGTNVDPDVTSVVVDSGTVNLGATDTAALAAVQTASEACQTALETSGGLVVNLGANNDVTVTGTVTADTELPSAAALSDAASNPTTPTVGSAGMMWNGTGWDRIRGDTTSGIYVNVKNSTLAVTQSGTWNVTNISGTVSLPTGAATAAKQPALGTAGTASSDVITVQGIASMTALKVDGSAVTQPVSGTVDLGATDNAVLDAIQTATEACQTALEGTLTVTGGGGGVEYTEGDTDATITGSAMMMEGAGNTLYPAQGDATNGLLVNLGSNNDVTVTGTISGTGTAGSAATGVVTVQGIGSMTPLLVTLSGTNNIGTVTAVTTVSTVTTCSTVTSLSQFAGQAIDLGNGTTGAGTLRVTLASDSTGVVSVDDNGSSLTVDAPVGTPVFVRLSDGSSAITTLPVSIASVPSHAVTNAGTFATQVDGAALTALQLIDDIVFTDDATFNPGTSKVAVVGFQADETATDSVDEGDAGAARMTLDRKVIVQPQPHTAGGLSIARDIDLDNSTLTVVKASAGQLYGWDITNTTTATVYVKFYDAASGTLGTGTPVLTIGIPGNSSDDTLSSKLFTHGLAFATGICVGAGTGVADADNTDPGTNAVVANIYYK